jgi:hypothetical protein
MVTYHTNHIQLLEEAFYNMDYIQQSNVQAEQYI